MYDCRHTKRGTGALQSENNSQGKIVEKRKSLIPIMKRALNDKKRTVLKVDKLYIDGTLYEGEAEADSDDEDDTGETGTQIEGGDEEET